MGRVVEEGVLEEVALGRSHVLRVADLERAFIKGYLRPSSEEMLTYVILSIPPPCRVEGYTPTEQLLRSMPKAWCLRRGSANRHRYGYYVA